MEFLTINSLQVVLVNPHHLVVHDFLLELRVHHQTYNLLFETSFPTWTYWRPPRIDNFLIATIP